MTAGKAPPMPRSHLLGATLLAIAALVIPAASASAATSQRQLRMDIKVSRFVVTKAGLKALGTASASLAGNDARKKVTLSVKRSSSCAILTLNLQELQLKLLGLNLDTSAINLRVTGDRGKTLGALFCKLARSLKIGGKAASAKAARSLNKGLEGRELRALAVRTRLRPQEAPTAQDAQAPAPSCQVLDLILGPLHLDLLGLVVDLYGPDKSKPVEVHVTADPNGGVLGAVFCKLANGQPAQ
jgi:hypothetical protein